MKLLAPKQIEVDAHIDVSSLTVLEDVPQSVALLIYILDDFDAEAGKLERKVAEVEIWIVEVE